jgi:hypothetical protein
MDSLLSILFMRSRRLCRSGQYMINDSLLRIVMWIAYLDIYLVDFLRAMTVMVINSLIQISV